MSIGLSPGVWGWSLVDTEPGTQQPLLSFFDASLLLTQYQFVYVHQLWMEELKASKTLA